MKDTFLYKVLRPIITILFKGLFRPKIVGLENIPKEGRIIMAGNHTSILDPLLLISSTKRNIHFMAKIELWQGPKKLLFSHMGLIPVDRKSKNSEAIEKANEYLNNDLLVGIFPEGTTEKEGHMLPFKMGAVKIARDTNTPIIPFVITGKFKLFSRKIKLKFLPPIIINGDLEKENKRLEDLIKREREDI